MYGGKLPFLSTKERFAIVNLSDENFPVTRHRVTCEKAMASEV